MKEDKNSKEKAQPQQRPEDAKKHNAQQEREYRKQKEGTMKNPPKQPRDEEAIEKYENIKSDEKRKKGEEE